MSSPDTSEPLPYALGHSDRELERLSTQARLIDPVTLRFFQAAGIAPGMRVLDVGSGAGDVAFLTAELVGERGEVVGVDRSASALAVATERAEARSLKNVSFVEGDLAEVSFDQPFDAISGRYVLQFQRDPAATVRSLLPHVRSGGPVVFQEVDWDSLRSNPPVPTLDRCCRWIVDVFHMLGTETRMGVKLHAAFVAAGLPAPEMRLEVGIGGGEKASDHVQLVADLAITLAPDMERLGVATAAEIGAETLAQRMRDEAIASGSVTVRWSDVGAWSRA